MKGGETAKPKTARRRRSAKKSTGEVTAAKPEKPAAVKTKKSAKAGKAPGKTSEEPAPEAEEKE
jgi:hypothetical protein